ncbi:MAG TPA: MotA/TolQ/ExbB proton channel family protein [Solirubrobacteraceae bacterium]
MIDHPTMTIPLASLENFVFHISNTLRVPVLVGAVLALAWVLVELGSLVVELVRRRGRNPVLVARATGAAREALLSGDRPLATRHLTGLASSRAMQTVFVRILAAVANSPVDANLVAINLADFDLGSLRRLERTRLLVRAGPALGLMGTLIPLSPALSALAGGDLAELTAKLRIAFSVTVVGLLVGMLAFGISLVRDRMYAQDLSVVEFVTAQLETVGQPDPEPDPEPAR